MQRASFNRRFGITLAGVAVMFAAGSADAALVTYDAFTNTYINPNKWYGEEGKQYGGTRTETRRAIVEGQLRIEAKGYSDDTSNTGTSTTRNAVVFATSPNITGIRSSVTMRTAIAGACAANTTPTLTRARIFGFFFNAGTPVPGSNYNDVFAGIQLYRASNSTDGAGVLRVSAFVGICTDDSCIGSTLLASQDMGTSSVNTATDLQVTWDATNNRFTFQRDAQAVVNLAYTVADSQPASFPVKRLEISNQIAHCTASRPTGNGGADFDNVKTESPAALAVTPMTLRRDREAAATFDPIVGRAN